MLTRDLKDLVGFSAERLQRSSLFETAHLWSDLLCFDRNQRLGPITDDASDAVFTIVAGEGVFVVDGKRRRLAQWSTVLVPAGAEVSIANASVDPLVVMVVAAPPPAARAVTG